MTRVVCVSNRVAVPKRGAAPGGLAVGVLSALRHTGGVWFGWGGELTDEEPGQPEILIRDNVTYITIRLRRRDFEAYYNGHANSTLWPLFHYLMRNFRYNERQQDAYRRVNRAFAERLVTLLEPDDVVWVHDYHLIPLAEHLRELGVTQPIGFFLHIPFPHIEMLRVLPTYAELLREMVAYDVIGFQTENDLHSFLAGVEYVWGRDVIGPQGSRIQIGTRSIRPGVFPIGIDVPAVEAAATAAAQSDPVKRLSASLLGRKLMVGVDRLDYSKGLIERFAAYQTFLESYPENLGKITFMGMNNVYYRFLHLVEDEEYQSLPARLRMNVIGNPGIEQDDFELLSLAVSAVNGCGLCITAHERKLRAHGVSRETIQSAVRIASSVHAVAGVLEFAEAA